MRRILALLAIVLPLSSTRAVAADPAPGNWKLVVVNNFQFDVAQFIVKLDNADGKWTTELVAASPALRNFKVNSITIDKGQVRLVVLNGKIESVFEGTLGDDKSILGSYGDDRRINAAKLIWTEDEKIEQRSAFILKKLPPPMVEMNKLQTAINQVGGKLRQAKDDDEKKALKEEITEKQKAAEATIPGLLKLVLANHSDDPAAMDAAILLIRGAAKNGATPDDVKNWAKTALDKSAAYGPRFRKETQLNLAEMMVANPALKAVAADYAKRAESEFGTKATTAKQVRVLSTLVRALGDAPEAKPFVARLDQLEIILDDEYIAKHAKLEVEPYAGRNDGGSRAVLMELFTGAQCPPCVAADIAFDKLCENYKQEDLILLQFHLHIPGPDPLTNSDTEARWKYYTSAFADTHFKEGAGVPTAIFNGTPSLGGGGPEDNAANTLKLFRKLIDPTLDEESKIKLSVKATRVGDVVSINASIAELPDAGDSVKLRIALVEESIRYAGSNGIRFHHHVVRDMPGGPNGFAVSGSDRNWQTTVNLTELRGKLTKYLDEFVAKNGPFPKANRPMDFKKLKAVAWVQDDKDENRAVLHAVMVDVASSSGTK